MTLKIPAVIESFPQNSSADVVIVVMLGSMVVVAFGSVVVVALGSMVVVALESSVLGFVVER